MANLSKEFETFYSKLQITEKRKEELIRSRENLRKHIKDVFAIKHPNFAPLFYIQGSYKMGTTIRTKDDDCDLDDGCYFIPKPDVTGSTLQSWVMEAVTGITDAKPIHKNKCVRVVYAAGYHIDLPVYRKKYKDNNNECPELAVRDDDYQKSDPREIVNWFANRKKDNPRLVRIISFLKAWCDNTKEKMPPGLAMTILAANNQDFSSHRDDIALKDTLCAISKSLKKKFECRVPGEPHDNIFEDYDSDKKEFFLKKLDNFISDAEKAITEKNLLKASQLWIKNLGDKFPLAEDTNDPEMKSFSKLMSLSQIINDQSVYTSRNGSLVSNENEGVIKHLPHKNYGDE